MREIGWSKVKREGSGSKAVYPTSLRVCGTSQPHNARMLYQSKQPQWQWPLPLSAVPSYYMLHVMDIRGGQCSWWLAVLAVWSPDA